MVISQLYKITIGTLYQEKLLWEVFSRIHAKYMRIQIEGGGRDCTGPILFNSII